MKQTSNTEYNSTCQQCATKHRACSKTFPCTRCVDLGIEHLCQKVESKKRGRPRKEDQKPVGVRPASPKPKVVVVQKQTLQSLLPPLKEALARHISLEYTVLAPMNME